MGNGPIFIGGLSFSGKTQLRMMLEAHPNLVITRRTYMWRHFFGRYGDLGNRENFERCLKAMLTHKHIRALEPDAERIRREYWQGKPGYARLFGLFHQYHAEKLGKPRWGDQLGFVEQYVGAIFEAYPEAQMIHMMRDPQQRVAESLEKSRFRQGKIGWELAQWRLSAQLASRNARQYPGRYLVVQCEELFSDAEKVIRAVCHFLGEEFVPQMLDGVALEDKRGQLTPSEQQFVQLSAAREISALGYSTVSRRLTPGEFLNYLLVDYPLNQTGMMLWNVIGSKQQH